MPHSHLAMGSKLRKTITMQEAGKMAEKKLEEYKQTQPEALTLFYNQGDDDHKFSRSIELYDAIPKYHWGKSTREQEKYLPSLNRQFKHRDTLYHVTISPGRLTDKDGNEKEYLPGQREELVEDALRKLACDGQGIFLDNHAGVVFSLYELEKELQRMGHGYNKNQIKEALLICGTCTITVKTEDGKTMMLSHIFETVGLRTRADWKKYGTKTKAFVRFNSLVTKSIKDGSFRQLNYEQCMLYRSVLARWFHKRLSHNYIQASFVNLYTISLSRIIQDSGMRQYAKLSDNLREVKKALEEMKQAKVLSHYGVEKIYGNHKNKMIDAKITLIPHHAFISEMKRSNKLFSQRHTKTSLSGRKQKTPPGTRHSISLTRRLSQYSQYR